MSKIVSIDNLAQRQYKRACNASYSGKLPEAVYYYKQAIIADRSNKKYFIDIISVFNQIGFFADTLSYAAEALELADLDTTDKCALYFYMGEACYCLGINRAAKRYIDLCVDTDSNSLFFKDAMLYKHELDNYFGSDSANKVSAEPSMFVDSESFVLNSILSTNIFENPLDEDGSLSYNAAENTLKHSPNNVGAILLGYSAAIKLNNTFAKRKYKSLIKSIKDCSDLDLQIMCNYFTFNVDDNFAKEIFASIYKENTFSREVGFALAIAFYNTGENLAAIELLKRTNMLEGGGFLSSFVLDMINKQNPPKRLPYIYAPCGEQMDILCSKMFELFEKPNKTLDDYKELESVLYIVVRFEDPGCLGEIIEQIDAANREIFTIIKRLLHQISIEPHKKIMFALLLHEIQPNDSTNININGDIVSSKELASYFKMRNFNVPSDLEVRFGRKAVGEAYYAVQTLNIIDIDAPDEEFSFIVDYLLTSESNDPNLEYLAFKYNLSTERATYITNRIEERLKREDETN